MPATRKARVAGGIKGGPLRRRAATPFQKRVANRLRTCRQAHDTYSSLSAFAEATGRSQATVSGWERAEQAISLEDFAKICRLLEVESDYLLYGKKG